MIIDVVEQINQSDLSPASKANALALLAMAHHDNGHLAIDWGDICAAFGHISLTTCRRHLGLMQAANLIHYSSNGDGIVYINFKAWLGLSARGRAKNDHSVVEKRAPTRAPDQPAENTARVGARKTTNRRAKNDQPARENDAPPIRTHAGALVGCLVDLPSNPESESDQPTNHGPDADPPDSDAAPVTASPTPPVAAAPPPPDAPDQAEQARTVALLIDPAVAVGVKRAKLLAAEHRFEYVRRVVAMFWDRLQARTVQAGKVITALDDRWGAPALDDRFMSTDFYRRHRTPAEVAQEDARGEELDSEDEDAPPGPIAQPDPDPEPDLGTPEHAWWLVRHEAETEQGGSFVRWLDGTHVVAYDYDANQYTVAAQAHALDWLRNRLVRQIVRKLTVITGRPAAVEFVSWETQEDHP